MPIKNRFAELHDEIVAWRRDFHENPELLYDVHRTAGLVADRLRDFGCDEVVEGIGRTGVVGVIHGAQTASGRVIGLRADMDALPMQEKTGLSHASRTPGAMHACGHDGHTSILLGAAKYLAETRRFDGTVVVIFQPAEEGGAGGLAMCEDGLLDRWNIEEVYGLHNMPGLPAGEFAIRPGALLASADEFTITVVGRGGHAAQPHTVIDPVVVAGHLIVALQSVASRSADPVKSLVVSVCTLKSDTESHNIIPGEVLLRGTVRSLDPDLRDLAETRIHAIVASTAEAFGATARIEYDRGYPVTMNAPGQTDFAADVAEAVAGKVIRDAPPVLAAEDFAYMLERRPGAYIMLGNGTDSAMVHHPAYDFNDEAIPAGCSWFAELVERRLPA
ncbi:amidohydrolase family protein [Pseudooceanicola batsensis HTCC2597]|uniref:Amidohydrolase family protein n=1 Tax=Pseudooceanicola batsensis (strain ATCC BAA-863 / DSM 15984 / KCTC 12145 / HTCC2597) TaxID=252305 RepID=A3U469_PSEBH|nr:M20 aminoacylase family protein [Pseudooceanicola batsensis]EAQ01056.1 amidohydrolase family protein [Pseudooceanicola batsensis HTCC2597]